MTLELRGRRPVPDDCQEWGVYNDKLVVMSELTVCLRQCR